MLIGSRYLIVTVIRHNIVDKFGLYREISTFKIITQIGKGLQKVALNINWLASTAYYPARSISVF